MTVRRLDSPAFVTAFLPTLLALTLAAGLPVRAADQAADKAATVPAGKALDKSTGKPAGKATDKPASKPAEVATLEDPMERLRRRLSERLAPGPAADTAPVGEVRVAPRPAATANDTGRAPASVKSVSVHTVPPVAGAPAAAAVRRPGAPAPAPGGHAGVPHWGYEDQAGPAGPAGWGSLKPEFAQCANGQRQSPIDIRAGLAVDLEPVRFDYKASNFSVIDNGHTVQVNVAPGNAIEVGGRRYELVQFHFHRPSEERIDGRQFEMSAHLVHKDAQGRLAVVGVLLAQGPAQPVVQQVWNNLPLERHEDVPARALLDPAGLLPADRRYFSYMGSLTTPPCSEGVRWVVMRTPVTLAAEQVELFARIYPMNARPVQAAGGRRILQSN